MLVLIWFYWGNVGLQWELSSKLKSRTGRSGAKWFCPLFYWLLVQNTGARAGSRRCPAVTWCHTCQQRPPALCLQGEQILSESPISPALSRETASPKGEPFNAYTPLCSEIGSSLSVKVLLFSLAETWPPFALCFLTACCLMDFHSELPPFPFPYFPFSHLKMALSANFLVPFLC